MVEARDLRRQEPQARNGHLRRLRRRRRSERFGAGGSNDTTGSVRSPPASGRCAIGKRKAEFSWQRSYVSTMPLSLAQAHVLIAAANGHALANGWKIAVAVVDEGGLLVALGRMDGAFPLSAQIAEAKAAGTALWHRDGEQLAASREAHEGFFDAVSGLVRLPLIPGPGSVADRRAIAQQGEQHCPQRRGRRRLPACQHAPGDIPRMPGRPSILLPRCSTRSRILHTHAGLYA